MKIYVGDLKIVWKTHISLRRLLSNYKKLWEYLICPCKRFRHKYGHLATFSYDILEYSDCPSKLLRVLGLVNNVFTVRHDHNILLQHAWIRVVADDIRAFLASMGQPKDWPNEDVQQFLELLDTAAQDPEPGECWMPEGIL